jgi:hypothetical protein
MQTKKRHASQAGVRKNIYYLGRQHKIVNQIDNFSEFIQIAIDMAADIMAWAMLKDIDPKKYNTGRKLEDHIDAFNAAHPQNKLTQRRTGKWPKRSANIQDLL